MELKQFRINNFRSIVDTNWCPFSRDGITVLVGQNESGKTSVLEALATTFSNRTITEDDLRSGEPLPRMYIRLECEFAEIEKELVGFDSVSLQIAQEYWKQHNNQLCVEFTWEYDPSNKEEPYIGGCALYDADDLEQRLATVSKNRTADQQLSELVNGPVKSLTIENLGIAIYRAGPNFVLFNERTGMLPNAIDLDEKFSPVGNGSRAARNYLTAAGIDLPKLLSSDLRTRESVLTRANADLTSSFNSFWSQTIGNETKLTLHCSIQFHDHSSGDKAGKPHLVFWISDGHTRLYPNQRS
jgi:hypothetical protein